ncbi:hypothetical protein MJT46_000013 [Ovis ammon polii x Ovis aries]|nr:hypothetical protein MJT46_000013 [Ovis ammon polii x Ovis aries]
MPVVFLGAPGCLKRVVLTTAFADGYMGRVNSPLVKKSYVDKLSDHNSRFFSKVILKSDPKRFIEKNTDGINLLKTDYTLRCFMAKSSIKTFSQHVNGTESSQIEKTQRAQGPVTDQKVARGPRHFRISGTCFFQSASSHSDISVKAAFPKDSHEEQGIQSMHEYEPAFHASKASITAVYRVSKLRLRH